MTEFKVADCKELDCEYIINRQIPELQFRTLRISEKIAGFEYAYQECRKENISINNFWKKRIKCRYIIEYFNLNDKNVKEKLKNMGFRAKVIIPIL